MTTGARDDTLASGVGIGLRAAHYADFLDGTPAVDWLEVHSENYFGHGGYDLHVLEHVRKDYPLSLHGVGLSLGSADELRLDHLSKLKRLVDRIQPALVSEHLSWGALGARHFNDLLPLPYTQEALRLMVERVSQAQDVLGRRILVENVSGYLAYRASEMSEGMFLGELAQGSGCGILLDINNLFVNAGNHGFDAAAALADFPVKEVGEIHLAGHRQMDDLLIDDHGSRVAPPVWALFAQARTRFGNAPVLIEWDSNIPVLEVLVAEAGRAKTAQSAAYV
jgi:uncharacterized protein (UPF0276 family)